MKIYVVITEADYPGGDILLGLYKTEEAAKKRKEKLDGAWGNVEIDEYETDNWKD